MLPFERVFEEHERDPELKFKLEEEAKHIFSWAVNGLQRLNKRGRFLPPAKCLMANSDYLRDNDTVEQWLSENDIEQVGSKCLRSDAWRDFKEYCAESGCKTIRKSKFFNRLKRKGHNIKRDGSGWYVEDIKLPNQPLG